MNKKILIALFIFLLALPILTNSSLAVYSKTANNFKVTITNEQHSISNHLVEFEIQNLEDTPRNFNLGFYINNTLFDVGQISEMKVYEWKPRSEEYPIYSIKNVTNTYTCYEDYCSFTYNCYWLNTTPTLPANYNCTLEQSYKNGTTTKTVVNWKPFNKIKLSKLGSKAKGNFGGVNVPKYSSNCKYDDFGTPYDCSGTKKFRIEWKTPIVYDNGKWGSSGYYAITDDDTGTDYDPWWNSFWNYRKPITIQENSGNDLTDYQVRLTIDTASLISAGKMNSDCSDIRFTDENDNEIPYWIESGCNSANTVIWVKVPSITASSTATIYMYYGNSGVSSASNGNSVFEFYDDFNDGVYPTYSGWTSHTTGADSITETSGIIRIRSGEIGDDLWTVGYEAPFIYKDMTLNNFLVQVKVVLWTSNNDPGGIVAEADTSNFVRIEADARYDKIRVHKIVDGTGTAHIFEYSTTAEPVWLRMVRIGSTFYFYVSEDGNSWTKIGSQSIFSNPVTLKLYTIKTVQIDYDDFFARKYTNPEPTYSIGSEETSPPPIQFEITITSPEDYKTYKSGYTKLQGSTNINGDLTYSLNSGTNKTLCNDCNSFDTQVYSEKGTNTICVYGYETGNTNNNDYSCVTYYSKNTLIQENSLSILIIFLVIFGTVLFIGRTLIFDIVSKKDFTLIIIGIIIISILLISVFLSYVNIPIF